VMQSSTYPGEMNILMNGPKIMGYLDHPRNRTQLKSWWMT
jgi:hypothetical protein